MAGVDNPRIDLGKVKTFLLNNGKSFPTEISIGLDCHINAVVNALTYLERKDEVTLWIGGKWSLFDKTVGRIEKSDANKDVKSKKTRS